MIKVYPVFVTVFISFTLISQDISKSNIGVIPVISSTTESVLFLDADEGEIKSFATFKEPIYSVSVSEGGANFFVLTKNHIIKGDVKTGNILESFNFSEKLGNTKVGNKTIYPSQNLISPLNITSDGKAIIAYNEDYNEYMELSKKIQISGESNNFDNDIFHRLNELSEKKNLFTQSTLYLANISELSFNKLTATPINLLDLHIEDRELLFIDRANNNLIYKDINSFKVKIKISLNSLIESSLVDGYEYTNVRPISERLLSLDFFKVNSLDRFFILYDTENKSVVIKKEVSLNPYSSVYPLKYINSSDLVYGDVRCTQISLPQLKETTPPQEINPDEYKNNRQVQKALDKYWEDFAIWKNVQDSLMNDWNVKLIEYSENVTNQDKCTLYLYKDNKLKELIMTIPNAKNGVLYNNRHLLVMNNFEYSLYDIIDQSTIWTVDIDF